jgi:hypothetical protein
MGFRCLGHGKGYRDGLPGKKLVVGVDQIDGDFVLARRQVLDVDGAGVLASAQCQGQAVDFDVQVADAGKDVDSSRAENRRDAYVLRPVLDQSRAVRQRQGSGRIDGQFSRGFLTDRDERVSGAET